MLLVESEITVVNSGEWKNNGNYHNWTHCLDKGPKRRNMEMRFGIWNVTSLYRAGSLVTVSKGLSIRFSGSAFFYRKVCLFIRESYQQLRRLSILVIGYHSQY
jgi:hypothetical protein